jgi:hypothetical protein
VGAADGTHAVASAGRMRRGQFAGARSDDATLRIIGFAGAFGEA